MQFVIGIFVVFWLLVKLNSCTESDEVKAKKERENQEFNEGYRNAEESLKRAREEGARALDEADAAIRSANTDRRAELEKKSISHRMSNKNGVRIDYYKMPDGRTVICTTTVSGNSPAMFNCD